MIGSLGRRIAVGAAAVALGGIAAIVTQSPALAADFSAAYTCTGPVLGTQSVTIDGSLTASPDPARTGTPVAFRLHVSQISLRSPFTINAWTMTTNLDVTGAETAQLQVTGSGGRVTANQPLTGDLSGTWTPTVAGTDNFLGGDVVVRANVFLLGEVTLSCTPNDPRPVLESLTVN